MRERDIKQRVVITGMGALTPLGLNVEETWAGLIAGRSGITEITHFDASHLPIRIAGEVKGFDASDYIDFKEVRRMARTSHLAVAVGVQAMADAGLGDQVPDPERSGVVMGTGIGGFDEGHRRGRRGHPAGSRRLDAGWRRGRDGPPGGHRRIHRDAGLGGR
jgi:3-oxoacyl-[acyl-carrier-protein] synthase II